MTKVWPTLYVCRLPLHELFPFFFWKFLYRLAGNELLWDQRIAVVSTYALIKNDDFIDILALSEHFLCTRYDLMQKAVGWMLREM